MDQLRQKNNEHGLPKRKVMFFGDRCVDGELVKIPKLHLHPDCERRQKNNIPSIQLDQENAEVGDELVH